MAMRRARHILGRYKRMKSEKQPWLSLYQLCAEYIMSRKQAFTSEPVQADLLTEHIFDDTAPNANSLMASTLIGAMWPNGGKSFRVAMPYGMEDELGGDTEEVKAFYEWVSRRMAAYMDNPKSGFITSLEEYMLDQGAFGISGILVEDQEDSEVPLTYKAVDAKMLHVDEGRNGFIDTIYMSKRYTVRQLINEYGFDNVGKNHQEAFLSGKETDTKIEVLHAIEPRMERDPHGFGVKDMPYASIHIDVANEKILKESGFWEMPATVTRFWKAMGEKYGRCPGMAALPSILEANAMGEAWTLAVEKTLDPALLVMDDGTMGGGVIDTSPGALNVVSVSGRIGSNSPPIQPLFTVGDLQWTAMRREQLETIIRRHFFVDRLLDFNSDQRMQNPEVMKRDELRGQSLNTTYSRQFGELFVPVLETSFNKLRRRNFFGVIRNSQEETDLIQQGVDPEQIRYIPEAVAKRMAAGEEVYKLEFISPATRIMQSQELQGIEHLVTTVMAVAPANETVLDVVDWDWTMRRVQELDGSPRETLLSIDRIKKIRDDRAQMVQMQMELAQRQAESETARNMGQAAASVGVKGAA